MAFFSQNSADYARAIQSLVKPTYTSKYNNLIEDTLNKILNKEEFSYDFNADPLYQNYKDQYTKLGKEAGINAAAAASTLTGGYGNSYAGTAAAQANQQYLTQLNDRIPELYNAAMNKYNMEKEDLLNKFGVVQGEEQRLYGQYRDQVSDYYSDLSDLRNGHSIAQAQENDDRDYNYKVSRDAVADSQWERTFNYNTSRDAVADSQWQQEFDTKNSQWQQEFDTKNAQWQKEYELALRKARSGGSSGSSSKKGTSTADSIVDYSSRNFAENIRKLVVDAYNRNDWSEDTVADYINGLVSRKVINSEDAKKLYENALYSYPQYRDRVNR